MEARGRPMPIYVNPAEFLLDLLSTDFAGDSLEANRNIEKLHTDWKDSETAERLANSIPLSLSEKPDASYRLEGKAHASFFAVVLALLHRSFIKSYRDVVAYGIRFAMYIGLAIMMGTVWLRLPATQSSIGPFTNAIVRLLVVSSACSDHPGLTKSTVLRLGVHVVHGRGLRPSLPRGPRYIHQGASEWSIRCHSVHDLKFLDRNPVSLYFFSPSSCLHFSCN